MLLGPLADIVFVDVGDADADQLVPFVFRQAVERIAGGLQMRRQRDAQRAQQLRAVDAGGSDTLLDLSLHRLTINRSGERQEVHRVLGRHRNILVGLVDADLGQRKCDQHGHVLVGGVEEAIADADLLRGNQQVLRAHLDAVVAHEDEATGGKLGGGVIGERRRRYDAGRQEHDR